MRRALLHLKIWRDQSGQDLIEYSLMAGFVAVAAAASLPAVGPQLNHITSKIGSLLTNAASQG